jgi:hypothetical protein
MAILETLGELGFSNAEIVAEIVAGKRDKATVKVRTSKGWTYEKFADGNAVREWAKSHKPE